MERENNAVINRAENIFGTEGEATEFFVYDNYRKYQKEAIDEIEYAFEQGYRYVILDAPVGSGKSVIGYAFARQSGSTHILTIQKLLQDQYMRDFTGAFVMKGRGAYRCKKSGGLFSCAQGICRRKRIKQCDDCPYLVARRQAEAAEITIHNFDSFYWTNTMSRGYTPRKLLIVDECHNVPNKYAEFLSFTVSSTPQYEVPEYEHISEYTEFLKSIKEDYEKELSMIDLLRDDVNGLNIDAIKREDEIKKILLRLSRYLRNLENEGGTEYIFDYKKEGRHGGKVTFKPLFVSDLIRNSLFRYADKVLMMSATVLDKDIFCAEIGLNPDEVYYMHVPSSFPVENHPIKIVGVGAMSRKYIDDTLPKMIAAIKEILNNYPDEKGIIQTHSEKIAKYIKRNLRDSRLTFNKDYNSPNEMLAVHKDKEGSFIVASGLREGLDLYGDLSTIQIFCKVPYPSLGDKWVKRRMEINPAWYGYMTTLMLVQAIGRSIRSAEDKTITYMLDSNFGFYYRRNKRFIPDYIRESLVWLKKRKTA